MSDSNSKDNNIEKSEGISHEWMIRPCHMYDDEYSNCTSIKARLNQYFIFGKGLDCLQWKRDSVNCYKWLENKDVKAANELIESEKIRRKIRLNSHYNNDVWEKRKNPPDNWNCPLPDYLTKEYEHSYLNIKSKELKGEIPPSFDPSGFCCIL